LRQERRIQGFAGETWGKETNWKTWAKMEYNIKVNLQHVGFGGMDWIALVQERGSWWALVNAVMNLRVPSTARNVLTDLEPISFSG